MKRIYYLFMVALIAAFSASCKDEYHEIDSIPVLEVEDPTGMSRTSVTLNGSIRTGHPEEIIAYGFLFGSTSDFSGDDTQTIPAYDESLYHISAEVKDLTYGATYYYAVYVNNGFERIVSDTKAFTMDRASAILSDFQQVDNTRSRFSAHISDDGGGEIKRVGFCWSEEKNPTIYEGEFLVAELDSKQTFTLSLPLEPTKTYYVRAFVQSRITEEESLTDAYSEEICIVPGPADNEIWYTSTDGKVVTPSDSVFDANIVSNTYENGRGVIKFHKTLTTLMNFTFDNCLNLLTITLPDALCSIGWAVFDRCENLRAFYGKFSSSDNRCLIVDGKICAFAPLGITEYVTPKEATIIGDAAFRTCKELICVEVSNGVTSIGDLAFASCTNLSSVIIPESVRSIGTSFFSCPSLTNVYCYPKTPPTITNTVFAGNSPKRRIYVLARYLNDYKNAEGWDVYDDSIYTMDDFSESCKIYYRSVNGEIVEPYEPYFGRNVTLVSNIYNDDCGVISFDQPVSEIGGMAFGNDVSGNRLNLETISIPNTCSLIGDWAFYKCQNLKKVDIPENSVSRIGDFAFSECKSLSDLVLPNGVTSLGESAFQNAGIKHITLSNNLLSIGDFAFLYCKELEGIVIGDGLETIGESAFWGCENLLNITIPENVKLIEKRAFKNCPHLRSVVCKAPIPPIGEAEMFDLNSENRKIYVPAKSLELYKNALFWSDYASDIYALEDDNNSTDPINSNYEAILGEWSVSSDSSKNGTPLTFNLSIMQDEPNKTFIIKGWAGYDYPIVAYFQQSAKNGNASFYIPNQLTELKGQMESYGKVQVAFYGWFYYDNSYHFFSKNQNIIEGTLKDSNNIELSLCDFKANGETYSFVGANYFFLQLEGDNSGKYLVFNNFPIGPFTMKRIGEKSTSRSHNSKMENMLHLDVLNVQEISSNFL